MAGARGHRGNEYLGEEETGPWDGGSGIGEGGQRDHIEPSLSDGGNDGSRLGGERTVTVMELKVGGRVEGQGNSEK